MNKNNNLPVLGTYKVFEPIKRMGLLVEKIEFVDTIPNLDDISKKWDVSDKQDGSIMAWLNDGVLKISGNGIIFANENCDNLFNGGLLWTNSFADIKSIEFNDLFDTSLMKRAKFMFEGCGCLEYIYVSNWNTKNLADAFAMFRGCWELKSIDLSNWSTSNLKTAHYMFDHCTNLKKVIVNDIRFVYGDINNSVIEFNPSLNTMDTFQEGFKIFRDGKIITLTPEEMSDFRYLEQACEGRRSLEWYLDENENDSALIEEMIKDEEVCYNVRDIYYDTIMQDSGQIENECTYDYIEMMKKEGY